MKHVLYLLLHELKFIVNHRSRIICTEIQKWDPKEVCSIVKEILGENEESRNKDTEIPRIKQEKMKILLSRQKVSSRKVRIR